MKVRDLLNVLRTDYIEISNINNVYGIEYLKKDNFPSEILDMEVVDVTPLPGLRKQLFDASAPEGDYVAAVKLVYDDAIVTEEVYTQETYQEKKEEPKRPNFGGMPNFGMFNDDLLSKLITPDVIESLTESDFFQNLLSPENIQEIINSEDFKNFMSNSDLSGFPGGFPGNFNPFGQSQNTSVEEDDDEDEYEEI